VKTEITETGNIKLEDGILNFINAYDFSIFGYETLQAVLVQHSRTPFWAQRFQVPLAIGADMEVNFCTF
jgi:hypothetical protein